MSNLDSILAALRGDGLSPAQAAGVAGNLEVESGFDPTAYNAREGAVGIAQWEGGRRTALDQYAAATGGSETSLTTQLGYMTQEFQTTEAGAFQRLLATNDPASAAAVFDQYYERSAGTSRAQRVADAQAIASGQPATTGPAAAAGGATATPAGFLGLPSINDIGGLVMKVAGGLVAGALVVIGVRETVRGQHE